MRQPKAKESVNFPSSGRASEEGFYLDDLAEGTVVDIETQHRHYRLIKRVDTHVRISGHPTFCPEPVDVEVEGSMANEFAPVPNPGFIGRGMHLVFKHPHFDQSITTSRIREIHKQR